MSTPALNPLVEKIRAAHPGAYDDMDDATLTKAVLAKYPQYSDLAAPPIAKPAVDMQKVPLSPVDRWRAQVSENAVNAAEHVAPAVKQAANDVYDVSAPSIATEVAKHLAGRPNDLKKLPPKMVMAWLAAGGLPEAEGAEAAPVKAEAPVVKAAETPVEAPTPAPKPATPTPATVQPGPVAATPEPPAQISFPPPKPKGKFQYDPTRTGISGKVPPNFDTNGITRDVDEDNAIEDAMRADLAKHGTIARMQANREFAAKNSMDTAKGVLQERAQNTVAAPSLIDAGAPTIGSVNEPVEFLNGTKAYKTGGQWIAQKGTQWRPVTKIQMKDLVTAAKASAASSAPESDDLLNLLQKSLDLPSVAAKKAAKKAR